MAKKKAKKKKGIDYRKIREFAGLGKCDKSPSKRHRLKVVGYPNPEFWGDGINQSSYDLHCIDCQGEFHILYAEFQKEVKA